MADAHGTLCRFYTAGACASCALMPVPHPEQVEEADARLQSLIPTRWEAPIVSKPWGFRTKAKMAVVGTAAEPVFTFPGTDPAHAVDLSECPLYPPLVSEVLESARTVIRRAQVPPYSVQRRRGEIKYVLVTASTTEAMVRFVLRSHSALGRIREHLGNLDPRVVVVSANIHPEHAATLEGPEEVHLAGDHALTLPVGGVSLRGLPRSFTQTNTDVASALYAQVAQWILASHSHRPLRVWDLYCGVGGFALTIAQAAGEAGVGLEVTGVEITPEAIEAARHTARELALPAGVSAEFHAADATAWAERHKESTRPDVLVVNPPRRGIGERLATWINECGPRTVVYSSCNPATLASDLTRMSAYEPQRGRLVDMFPHSPHNEAVVILERTPK